MLQRVNFISEFCEFLPVIGISGLTVKSFFEQKSLKETFYALNLYHYCLTACLYAKCSNLIGWILELGPSIHFRIDGPDRLYGFRSKLKQGIFGKMVEKLLTEVVKC